MSSRNISSQRPGTSRMSQNEEESVSSDDRKALVTEVVMYILAKEASKVPAKKLTITKFLPGFSRNSKTIILEAKDVLSQVFGYELIDADGKYFVVNKFAPSEIGFQILRAPTENKIRNVLLLIVLSVVFMEGGTVREDTVWNFLELLKIKVGAVPDPVFGDVKKLLSKDFVSMLYLQLTRREGTDPPVYEFSLGVRAEAEIPKRKILEFVCKMYGNKEHDWPVQLKDVEDSEGAEAQQLSQLIGKRMRLSQPEPSTSRHSRGSRSTSQQ